MKKIIGSNKKLFLFLCIPFILNLGFLITDYLAGKMVKWQSIFYSPVSNENWLEFWAIFLSTIVTFFLLLHYYKELQFNKKKIIYENNIESLKKENEIVLEYLNEIEMGDISEIVLLAESFITKEFIKKEVEESILSIIYKKSEKIKKLNFIQLKLDLTNLRIKKGREENEENEENEIEKFRYKSYENLILLRRLYGTFLKNISDCMVEFLNGINEEELDKRNDNFNKLISKVNKKFYDSNKEHMKGNNSCTKEIDIISTNIEVLNSVFNEAVNNFQTYYIKKFEKNNEILSR